MGFDITGLGSAFDFAKGIMDRFWPSKLTESEKAQAQLGIQQMLEERDKGLIEAQKAIIVAELQQGDDFTKRARPSVIYCGLIFIFLVHVAFPIVAFFSNKTMPTLVLPEGFWWAWSGISSAWVIGRTAERNGSTNKIINMISSGISGK